MHHRLLRSQLCMSPAPLRSQVLTRWGQVDQVGNLAAFATIDDSGEMTFTTFKEQKHPPIQAMAYAGGGGFL